MTKPVKVQMWRRCRAVDEPSEGADAGIVARFAGPLDLKATADEWWELFMDDDELPKVGCKPDRPVKVAAHKLVPVEETRRMMRGLHIGTHDADDAECGAEAECAEVLQRGAQKAVVKESIKDAEMVMVARMTVAEYSKFLDQEMVLERKVWISRKGDHGRGTRVSPHKTKTDQLLEHARHMLLLARLLQR